MASLNKVFLIGRLGSDPALKAILSGKSVVNVGLATSEFYKDQSGNKQEKTEWHNLQFWDKLADIVSKYCHKGSQIHIEGSLQTRKWEKNGQDMYTTSVVVRNMQMLDSKQSGGQQQNNSKQNFQNNQYSNNQSFMNATTAQGQDDFIEDDVPF